MIPLKLHIKNFLSYGSELQTIDFTPYHLICFSGKNGHGKSALLDAITWAVWGIARKTATSVKADQGLLRLGQQQMMVVLDFSLGQHTYRVRREFSFSYGKAQVHLDFGMIDPLTQKLIPLTDKTIRDTQKIIDDTLNIDFETFTNSAFLKQGQANEFSKKSARERKDIIATILGLNQYDVLKKKALEKVKEAQLYEKTLCAFQDKIMIDLQKKEIIEKEIASTEQILMLNAQKESALKQKKDALEQQYKLLAQRIQKHNQLLYQKELLEKTSGEEIKYLQELRSNWRAIHAKQKSYSNTQLLYDEQERLHTCLSLHHQKLQKSLEIKELLLKHKEELQKRTAFLQQNYTIAHMEMRIAQEQQQHTLNNTTRAQQETQKHHQELLLQISALEKQESELAMATQTVLSVNTAYAQAELFFEKRKSFYQKYTTHGNILHQKIKNLTQKQSLVKENEQAACPLCEQNLSASRRRFLHQQFNAEYTLLTHQYQRIVRVIGNLKPLLMEDHAQLAQKKKEIETLNFSLLQQEELKKQILVLTQQAQIIAAREQELHHAVMLLHDEIKKQHMNNKQPDLTTLINSDAIYQEHSLIISDLEKSVDNNNYCKQSHEKDQQHLEDLQRALKEVNTVQQELLKQSDRKQTIRSQCHTIKNIFSQMKTIQQDLIQYADIAKIESNLHSEKQSTEDLHDKCAQEKNTLIEQKGRLLNEQQKLALLESEFQKNNQERQNLARIIDDYSIIAHAASKDGIQALLIEEAIPEIEQEANILLSKLTNNQAHITIESLRDLKKGGTKETLDIKISDATGSRPYELFSGGEAFRIDFALRIAISKLLARRAGTALQTLIIDEGFGSQDDEGLAHIMDALYKIQDDFAKIIIVSHLDALKEQFPVHFVVHKTSQGSNVTVIEHG